MTRISIPLVLQGLCVLLPFAMASNANEVFDGLRFEFSPSDHGIAPGEYSRSLTGNFLDATIPDSVFINRDTGTGVVCLNPGLRSWVTELTPAIGSLEDLAIREGDGDVDRLYAIVDSKLVRFSSPAGDGVWTETGMIDASGGICRIVGANLDLSGGSDLISLEDDNVTVRGHYFASAAGDASTEAILFTLPTAASDILALDFDGDGVDEIAFVTSQNVLVYDTAGVQLASYFAFVGTKGLTAVATGSGDAEALAWYATAMTGEDWVFAASGPQSLEGPYQMGTFSIGAISAADFDGDGDAELFLTEATDDLVLMLNQNPNWDTGTASFSIAAGNGNLTFDLPYTSGALERSCAVVCADLDGDGDADILQPEERGDQVVVLCGETVNEADLKPAIDGPIDLENYQGSGTPKVHLTLAEPNQGGASPLFGAPTHIRIEVLLGEDVAGLVTVEPSKVLEFPVSSSASTIAIKLHDLEYDNGKMYTLILRYLDKTGAETLVYPGGVHNLTFDSTIAGDWEQTSGFAMLETYFESGGGGGSGALHFLVLALPLPGDKPIDGSGEAPFPVTPPFTR